MNRTRSTWYSRADTVVGLSILSLPSGERIAGQGRSAPAAPAVGTASATTAFVDVAVIPMDQERVLEHQTYDRADLDSLLIRTERLAKRSRRP